MTLPLTPEMLRGAYEYLRACPPFRRWKLPPAEEVAFYVGGSRTNSGEYGYEKGAHWIRVSDRHAGHTATLLFILAHEMVHLKQGLRRPGTKLTHDAEFRRLSARVCKLHGFDPKMF